MKKRTLSLLLLIAMLASACGSTDTPASNDTTTAADTTATVTTADPDARDTSDLPDRDLGGFALRVLQLDPAKDNKLTLYLIAPDEENGDILNDTIYQRNSRLQDKYNFTIENVYAPNVYNTVNQTVLAGDDVFDVALAILSASAATMAPAGLLYDLRDLPNLNLDKNYWDQSFIRDLSVANRMFYASGDILAADDDGIMVTLYNTSMAKDYNLPSLYDAVYEGTWTYDKFTSLIKQTAQDINGDSKISREDTVGLLFASNNCFAPYFASAQTYLVTKDANDLPVFSGADEKMHEMYTRMMTFLDQSRYACDWITFGSEQVTGLTTLIGTKQALFQNMMLSQIRRLYRDVETDFGILPLPKFDENQETYSTSVYNQIYVATVPATITRPEETGFALEAIAAASDTLTNAYYDICLNAKYTRDEESFEMINIARENLVFDVIYICDFGGLKDALDNAASSLDNSLASIIASNQSATEAAIKDYVDAVKALD